MTLLGVYEVEEYEVEEYDTDGEFVRSFTQKIMFAHDVTVANDGRVMVLGGFYVLIFSESGDYLEKFRLQFLNFNCFYTSITFHREGEHVIVSGSRLGNLLRVQIYSRDGEFVHSAKIPIGREIRFVTRITWTTNLNFILLQVMKSKESLV